jgi:hypothetical protein
MTSRRVSIFNDEVYQQTPAVKKPKFVTKDGSLAEYGIPHERIELLLDELVKNYDKPIEQLPPDLRSKLEEIIRYVNLLHGKPHYQILYDSAFSRMVDLKDKITPGTIGGYIGGCISSRITGHPAGCAASCAGSMPPPTDDTDFSLCDVNVFMCRPMTNAQGQFISYRIDWTFRREGSNQAIIYIPASDFKLFTGFSKEEKAFLTSKGITVVALRTLDDRTSPSNFERLEMMVERDQSKLLKSNDRNTNEKYNNYENTNNSGLGFFLVFLLIILIVLLFVGYRVMSKHQ